MKFRVVPYKEGFVIERDTPCGWKKVKMSEYGSKGKGIKVFLSSVKAMYVIDNILSKDGTE